MAVDITPFDVAGFIEVPEAQIELLREAFAIGDPAYIDRAIRTVARARGIVIDAGPPDGPSV